MAVLFIYYGVINDFNNKVYGVGDIFSSIFCLLTSLTYVKHFSNNISAIVNGK